MNINIRRFLLLLLLMNALAFLATWVAGYAENAGAAARVLGAGQEGASVARFSADPGSPDHRDITVRLDAPGFALRHLVHTQGDAGISTTKLKSPLTEYRDYMRDGSKYTFLKAYLDKLPSEVHEFTFFLNKDGLADPTFLIEIVDSRLVAVIGGGLGKNSAAGAQADNSAAGAQATHDFPGVPGGWWRNPFADIALDDWFYDDVLFTCALGLFHGTDDSLFSPGAPMTRAMLVSVMHRYSGDTKYAEPVAWAVANGIARGVGAEEKLYAPKAPITRQEFATFIFRLAQYMGVKLEPPLRHLYLTDEDLVEDYALDAVRALNGAGIMLGDGKGNIEPLGYTTRAQSAAILRRFINYSAAAGA
jgi:hypothetical protein